MTRRGGWSCTASIWAWAGASEHLPQARGSDDAPAPGQRCPRVLRMMQVLKRWVLWGLCLLWLAQAAAAAEEVYMSTGQFVTAAFSGQPSPQVDRLWLTAATREHAERLLGHPFTTLRVRYWHSDARTAWVLEEIGKEKPITIGVVIEADRIVNVDILAFRESRGWEVRYPFFTDQFTGLRLTGDGGLNRPIDGITGATLSVRAVSRASALALYFHQQVATPYAQVAPQ